ncbi:VTT domain-containing protein [Prosthecochloris sp. N3]|uniref:VTT domain-containing protein n=1 Tax=Prosthecochloris ethylica TaxID=2743976 RepID=A0ABR9XQC2_9CHLB|nr:MULTISPECIES: VTT domain-containing protein [Prosthecochloris]MEC9487025.1 VTT domain-containing protein [Prosthecochloris sp.]MBF0585399.1 VTT domain-containing protein [Prosthecochloris ethylica]MBF0636185.1 VTT domain-containing protein [Prosthecochloris ethylica]NUK46628.1 VTT domain-containing protein [Prosthecochloris ethylica]RNA64759.1 DedA family protein [Prosthecochloris sp. ZM_2]
MLESVVAYLQTADPLTVYVFLFCISFLENVVPPIPGDVPVAFIGYLIVYSEIGFAWSVAVSSLGSTLGFMVMYYLSRTVGLRIYSRGSGALRHGAVRWIHKMFPPDEMEHARVRFAAHGYLAVLVNRFLFGSRAVISILAGFLHLRAAGVFAAALCSSVVWYILLLYGGYLLGENWQQIGAYMTAYTIPVSILAAIVLVSFIVRHFRNSRKKGSG